MAKLSLSRANRIISQALAEGSRRNFRPLSAAVFDAGGNIKAYQAQDGIAPGRFEVACGKARGCLFIGSGSRALDKQVSDRPHFLASLTSVIPGGVVPVGGGVLIVNTRGETLGAIGVTGDTSDNDEICAIFGVEQAGFTAVTG